jgi:peptide/nickel transport system substrate-binding protein
MKRLGLAALSLVVLGWLAAEQAGAQGLIETPMFKADVEAGRLPPVRERVPQISRVIDVGALGREPGKHGGQIRMLMGDQKDLRMMVVYGYSRLIGYDDATLALVPDMLLSYEVEGDRVFTFRLRPGHRWSDGHPFTAEDFRYFWHDVVLDKKLYPSGPPPEMLANGKPPTLEVLDPHTVRYTWEAPNSAFLPAIASARPLYLYMPAHYMKQFHAKYTKEDVLEKSMAAARVRSWRALHERKSRMYRPENPDLPSLDPWYNSTPPPSSRFVFKRNPYFHRVDENGRQLPYVDEVVMSIGSTSLVPAQVGAGESDLQARYIRFDNYTFLKEAERNDKLRVKLWEMGEGSRIAIVPNLNANDDVWRNLLRDVRVRRALSLAIDRREINQAIYFGLARESSNTMLPRSPLFRQEYADAWSKLDLALANKLLDDAGLGKRDRDGRRLLPDGRRAEVIIETSGENTEEADVLSLVHDTWLKVGIKLYVRPTQRDLFRKRIYAGETIMSVWKGLDNAIATADMSPDELAPTSQAQLQWPKWGNYYETHGKEGGEPVDMPAAKELLVLLRAWHTSQTTQERAEVWHKMLSIDADQVFTIGIVNATRQPIVAARTLVNVPDNGIFNFNPGGYFGRYLPDTFWYRDATQ